MIPQKIGITYIIMEIPRYITLVGDSMWINIIRFLIKMSNHVHFITNKALKNAKNSNLKKLFFRIMHIYVTII